jgi:hypothetical protein
LQEAQELQTVAVAAVVVAQLGLLVLQQMGLQAELGHLIQYQALLLLMLVAVVVVDFLAVELAVLVAAVQEDLQPQGQMQLQTQAVAGAGAVIMLVQELYLVAMVVQVL